jgi:hypothetical protein
MMIAIKRIWQHKMRYSGQLHRLAGSLPWHFLGTAKDSKERMEVMKRVDRLLDERLKIAAVSGTLPLGG